MVRKNFNFQCLRLIFIAGAFLFSIVHANGAENTNWLKGKTAVSLSYDDALDSQLDNVIPALNSFGFLASFYVVPTSNAFQSRLEAWRSAAKHGHELGNHTLFHSCRASLDDREWVQPDRDLDTQSAKSVIEEVKLANILLQALDGRTQRTFAIPCGDLLAGGVNYVDQVKADFLAIKGQGINSGFSTLHVANGESGEKLVQLVREQTGKTALINIIFHGVGADYLSVTNDAHIKLLKYLDQNSDIYWVDTYFNIMKAKLIRDP